MKPTTVEIIDPPIGLSTGKIYTLKCISSGSVPAAEIIWIKKGQKFGDIKTQVTLLKGSFIEYF